jgi:hypothetical protein
MTRRPLLTSIERRAPKEHGARCITIVVELGDEQLKQFLKHVEVHRHTTRVAVMKVQAEARSKEG